MGFLGLAGGGGFAGADGPDRFVSDNRVLHLFVGQARQAPAHLRVQDLFGLPAFAFGKRFPDANNRLERGGVGGQGFFGDQFVRFLLVLAPLGMAQNDVAHGKFLEHARRDFAGERAEVMLAHVLRAEADVRVEDRLGNFAQRREGRADDDVHFLARWPVQFSSPRTKVQRLGHGFVHLPVAGDDQFSFFVHG